MNYVVAQDRVRIRLGIRDTPAELIAKWDALVSECEHGYSWDFSEYENEMVARDWLEVIVREPELQPYEEHNELVGAVRAIDLRFSRLVQSDMVLPSKSWWRGAILRFAGVPYVEYMRAAYGRTVEVVER